jgi:hypothetical protein
MKEVDALVREIVARLKEKGFAEVEGYNRFVLVRSTGSALYVLREKGTEAKVPLDKIRVGLSAIRGDHSVYTSGPNALRKYGITHVNSPVWSLVHLLSLTEIVS